MGRHVNDKAHILTPDEMESMPHLPAGILDAIQIKGGRRPEAWILVNVEEAYVHCSKHVPLMKRLDKHIAWGSDDEFVKGGDFFRTKQTP